MEDREDSEDDQFFFSRAPRMPEDDIIRSEVAILTGGRDQHGRPIIALPAKYHNILESKVKASGMDSLLRYFIDITRVADRKRGFAFVTDLRFSTLDFILLMKSILNSIQAEMKGAIGACVLYVILPLNKKTNKDTLTHLALRQSRKKTNKNIIPPYFQSVAVDDEVELYNYIEKSHLTPDLGGYLQYSHQEWVAFRRIVEPFFANFESVQVRLSSVYQRLATMGKTNAGRGKEKLKQAHDQLQEAYNDIKRGLQLDVVLDQCEDLLARFGSSDEDDIFAVLAQKPILKETKDMVKGCYDQLVAAKAKIEGDWDEMSGRITHALQLIEYKEDVTRLLNWFKTRKERDLEGGPDVADNLSRAEMLCHHFETGLLAKAEEKLSKAFEVVDRGERLVLIDNNNRSLSEIAQLFKTLKQDAEDFQDTVQTHRHVLQSVYQFHQLYNRARRWYVSCIRFLPSDLCGLHSDLRSRPRGPDHQALKLQWEEDIRRFLHKQPALAKEELKRVKAISEDIGATSLRKKGRLLSYRCLILTNLLSHSEKVSTANVKDILKWQSEMNLRSDDSASQQSEVAPSDDRTRKTPLDSSLDTERNDQRHRRNQNSLKKTNDDNDLHHRGTQAPDKAKRHNGPSDTYPNTPSNTVDTNNDDPLIQRLGHRGSFYNRYGDTQGQTLGDEYDEADGRDRWGDARRNKYSERLSNGAVEHAQQLSPLQQLSPSQQTAPATQFARDRSQSSQPAPEHGQTYGIYGDSDVEGDTAIVIHHQGPPHGLPEHMLPGNQILQQVHAPSGSPHFAPSTDPSNVAFGNERLSYGLIQQDPPQFQSGYTNSRHAPQRDAHGVYPQNGHTLQHASLNTHHNGTPANRNTNNNSSPSSKIPDSQGNHAHPGLFPSYVNGATSTKRSPMSFHGSLMNIHQSHLDDSSAAAMNSSPVVRHRSLMNLSRSPIIDQPSVQYNSVQTSPARSDYYVPRLENRIINTSLHNGETHSAQQAFQNSYNPASLRMAHGVSEPSVNVALRDTASPYNQVLANLMQLSEANTTGPLQSARTPESSRSKKARTVPSRHSLSRSEMDLRYVPQNRLPPNGLSHSRQISSNSLVATTDPSAALTSYDKSLRDGVPDPQVEYYKKLYSTSTPLHHFTTASGRRKVDHTLDPSTHTWMHEVPSTQASHHERLAARIPNTSPPLSPLALLEMEVAMKTMDAEEAIKDDEYNEQQMRRQAVINSILNQSESDPRSRDVRAPKEQVVSPYGHRGKSGMRQKHVNSLSSPRKADKNMPRKASHSDATRSRLYSPLNHKASATPETFEFSKTTQSENGLGEHPRPTTTSLGIHHATPISRAPRQSVVVPRGLSRTERQLGLSTTLPQEENSRALHASNELDQKPTFVGELGVETSDRSAPVYGSQGSTAWNTAGENFGRLTPLHHSDRLLAPNEEVDWRQEHLRELGLPPRMQHPDIMNPNLNLSKHANQSEYNTGWRPQHLQELRITSNGPLSSLRENPTRSETRDNDWRRQHLIELGLSPDTHHSTLNTAPTLPKTSGGLSYSKKDWRHQHLLELGISPSEHLSLSGRNTNGVGSKSTVQRGHASELAVSPSLRQRPKPSAVESGFNEVNMAPMTRRLQGVLEGGHSPDDVEETHQLAEETAKKSVRFAHLSEESILDGEERAQEELAERLHQLELKLQGEEYSLMYKDVLDGEKVSLDQQLRELDQQEELARSHTNHHRTGPQRLLEGAVQPIRLQNDYHYQQMVEAVQQTPGGEALPPRHAKSRLGDLDRQEEAMPSLTAHQGTHVGALKTTRDQNGRPDQQIGQSVHPQMRGVLQPQHVERRQHFQASQHPDAIVPGSPAKLADAKYGQRSQSAAASSRQQVLEEDAQPMLVSIEEQNKAMEPNRSEKYAIHPTRSPQALLDGPIDNPAVRDSPRHQTVVSVAPDSRHAGDTRLPGEKELDHLIGETHESEKSVAHPTKLPQTLGNSQNVSRSNSSEMIRELDDVIPSGDTERALLTERDHTAADYIACALGIDYVNKRNLTVQPYSNSSKSTTQQLDKQLDQSGNLSYSQSERSQVDATKDIKSPSTLNDSRPQNDSENAFRGIRSSDKEGTNMRGFYNSHVELPKPEVSSEESPCSPIRKWLKEKETSEVLGMKSSRSEPNLTGRVEDEDPVNHGYTNTFELPINAVRFENPTISSQSASPMRRWLREKEEIEARESRDVKDFASPNGSVIDGGLGNVSNGRPSTKSVELESSEDLTQSPSRSRGRTNSLIPVPVGSKRAGGSQKQMAKSQSPKPHETRRSSSSAIPVSKSSSIGELSSSVSSAAGRNSPDTDQVVGDTMQKADIQSKKSNQYSKIPVKKVYRVLKDGGYLEDTSHPKEPNSARQVSPEEALPIGSTVEHSESDVPETQRSRPVLERQGTFTKEPRPTLTREGTFTIEGDDDNRQSESLYFPSQDSVAATQTTDAKNIPHSTFSPLALVLDHMVKKGGGSSTSTKRKTSGGKKHDSAEEIFENSSTESSMSPTTKSTIITTNKPTTNLHNSRSYFINVGNRSEPNQHEVAGSKARGHEVGMETYDGLTESDRKEHEELDENELERMMASKSQLAEIRNLEIENGHLAYERKEFEAHLIKNMQQQQVNASDEG